jgi:hypothetical protein
MTALLPTRVAGITTSSAWMYIGAAVVNTRLLWNHDGVLEAEDQELIISKLVAQEQWP